MQINQWAQVKYFSLHIVLLYYRSMETMACFPIDYFEPRRLVPLAALSKWNEFITHNTTTLTNIPLLIYIQKQRIYEYNLFRISEPYYILITFINMQYAMFRWAAPDAVLLCSVVRDSKLHNKTEIACWISNNNTYTTKESFVPLEYIWMGYFFLRMCNQCCVRSANAFVQIFSSLFGSIEFLSPICFFEA